MPVVPVSLLEPVWEQFAVLLPDHPDVAPTHPLGCHRRRVPDRVVFDHVVAGLVHGSGYERIVTPGCSDRTIRRRLHDWAEGGLAETLHALVLAQYDRMNGYGKLRRCTEKASRVVDFYLFLTAAFVVTRCLIQRARARYRWPGRPTTRRLP